MFAYAFEMVPVLATNLHCAQCEVTCVATAQPKETAFYNCEEHLRILFLINCDAQTNQYIKKTHLQSHGKSQ